MSPASLAVQSNTPAPAAAPGKPGGGKGKAAGNAAEFGALMSADAGQKGAEARGKASARAESMAKQAAGWADRGMGKLKADDARDAEAAHDPKAAETTQFDDPLALLMAVVMQPQQAADVAADSAATGQKSDDAAEAEAAAEAAVAHPKSRGGLASLLAERQARSGGPAETVGATAVPETKETDAKAPEAETAASERPQREPAPQPDAAGRAKRDPQASPATGPAQVEAKVTVVSSQVAPVPAAPVAAPSPTGAALVMSLDTDGTLKSYATETASTLPASDAKPLTTLKLQLHPAELGNVTVKISGTGEEIAIEVQVESTEARHRLSSDSDAIVKSLRGLGYDVDRFTVQQVAPSANAGQQQSATGGGRGDGFTAFEQRGGERGQNQQNHANSNGRDNGEHRALPQAPADRGGAAGAVYI